MPRAHTYNPLDGTHVAGGTYLPLYQGIVPGRTPMQLFGYYSTTGLRLDEPCIFVPDDGVSDPDVFAGNWNIGTLLFHAGLVDIGESPDNHGRLLKVSIEPGKVVIEGNQ